MKEYNLQIGEDIFNVKIKEERAGTFIVDVDDKEISVQLLNELLDRKNNALEPYLIKSTKAGQISALLVKAGDKISLGQKICTLEVDDQEIFISSDRSGQVDALLVNVGQVIEQDHPLISLININSP